MHTQRTTPADTTDQNTPNTPADDDRPATRRANSAKRAGSGSRPPGEANPNRFRSNPAGPDGRGTADQDPKGSREPGQAGRRPLAETFVDERDDVLTVINELVDELDRYEEIRERLEHELTETHQQNQTAEQRVQELEWQTVTLQTRVEALEQVRHEVALLEEEIADANTRAQRSSEQLARAEKDNVRFNSELKSANKQLEELWSVRKERDGLRVDLKNTGAKLGQLERAHKELQEERGNLHLKLQETQITLEEARTAKHKFETELRAAEDRNENLRTASEESQRKLEDVRTEKKGMQVQLTRAERESARLIEQQQFFECELTSLRSMNRTAEAALANVKKAFSEVRTALTDTKTRTRRRALQSWPRTCNAFYGAPEASVADPDAEAVSGGVPTSEELSEEHTVAEA